MLKRVWAGGFACVLDSLARSRVDCVERLEPARADGPIAESIRYRVRIPLRCIIDTLSPVEPAVAATHTVAQWLQRMLQRVLCFAGLPATGRSSSRSAMSAIPTIARVSAMRSRYSSHGAYVTDRDLTVRCSAAVSTRAAAVPCEWVLSSVSQSVLS